MTPKQIIENQFNVINDSFRKQFGQKETKLEVRCECDEPFKSWQDIDRVEFSRGNNLPPGYTQQELDTD